MPSDQNLSFPERHLGLLAADERSVPERLLSAWAEVINQWCDLDAIMAVAKDVKPLEIEAAAPANVSRTCKCRIGIALDEAFHFYYVDNLSRLERAGAQLVMFSPVHDAHLPEVDGIYIGGGYPEAYAEQLAHNSAMRREIASFAADGGVVYGECGGLMYLCSELRTLEGRDYPMCAVVPARVEMCDRLQALGYVEARTHRQSILGDAGTRFRGHQFRYSRLTPLSSAAPAFRVVTRYGGQHCDEGFHIGNTIASYVHAHWASNPAAAAALVDACSRNSSVPR